MFKVGDLVRIKSRREIIDINGEKGLSCPVGPALDEYCCKTGKVIKIMENGSSPSWVILNISKDFYWRSIELTPMKFDNFFSLRMWV